MQPPVNLSLFKNNTFLKKQLDFTEIYFFSLPLFFSECSQKLLTIYRCDSQLHLPTPQIPRVKTSHWLFPLTLSLSLPPSPQSAAGGHPFGRQEGTDGEEGNRSSRERKGIGETEKRREPRKKKHQRLSFKKINILQPSLTVSRTLVF